jgi:hypothetical protein
MYTDTHVGNPTPIVALRLLRFLVVLAMSLMPIQSAWSGDGRDRHGGRNRDTLTGNWIATVIRPAPLPLLLSLATYFDDGNTLEESNSNVIRSLGHGSWEKDGHRQFTRHTLNFTFDAARNFAGTTERFTRIELSEDGNTYRSLGTVTRRFDASGNLISTVEEPPGIETARRY